MDTRPLEIEAESYTKSKLIGCGFNVTKPDFDTEGTDLLLVDTVKTKLVHILRIQSKGRNISKSGSSNITIPCSYVDENFVVFLYLKLENYESKLYIFFYEDILKWSKSDGKYVLNFTKNSIEEEYLTEREFSASHVHILKEILRKSIIKKYTTVFIDSIFLNKAIKVAIKTYQNIYPNKKFEAPKLQDVIKHILSYYDNFKTTEKTINILYVYNPVVLLPTETIENIPTKFLNDQNTICDLRLEEIDTFVNFRILDFMERTINSENIILVADDIIYENTLNKFKETGIEVTLVQFNSHNGRQMFTHHMWGDIIYPLGLSIGLSEREL